jgi:hypothetical protein
MNGITHQHILTKVYKAQYAPKGNTKVNVVLCGRIFHRSALFGKIHKEGRRKNEYRCALSQGGATLPYPRRKNEAFLQYNFDRPMCIDGLCDCHAGG